MNKLKKRLDGAKGRWAEELPYVLWAYWTTPRRSTGETPFSLSYGVEAVIPVEVNLCSARVNRFVPSQNDRLLVECLDLLEEYKETATIRLAEYQQKLAWRYNQGVKTKEFSAGEYARYECREAGPNLGRALQGYCHCGCRSVLFGGLKRETAFLTMECS